MEAQLNSSPSGFAPPTVVPRILVTGGSGNLGRRVVARLRGAGQSVRVMSRNPHAVEGIELATGDLSTGIGVDAALAGVEVVVHLAGTAKGDGTKARRLVDAAAAAGVRHLVFISVVGADRVPIASAMDRAMFGYFDEKHAAEIAITESGIPWTTLRATQFFDIALVTAAAMAKLPLIPVPAGVAFQPIDADEVAARLVELTLGTPAGLVAEMGGPQVLDWADLVRAYLAAAGKHRLIVRVPTPGRAAAAIRAGANLARDHAVGRQTWQEFLAGAVGAPQLITPPGNKQTR
jgi:uncharacterized protein YbjT (DUF2867 family)